MHYQQSAQILQLLNSSQRTFVNCHINADIDSIGSALAISNYLQSLGKKAEVYSPNKLIPPLSFLKGYESIKVRAHTAWNTEEGAVNLSRSVLDNITAFVNGEPVNVVN
jgi:nanoRNase/pAp phosphatase (c-di-AMP/oligoRNAs hydrolase)